MPNDNDNNEFDFLPPAEPPPSFNQEKDHYHEEVEAEDFGMVEDFGLQMEAFLCECGLCWRRRWRQQNGECVY
jgi:hypothetical protein